MHLFVYICMWGHHGIGAEIRRQLEIVCSLLPLMNPRVQTQFSDLGASMMTH